jgi:hypothetical protein
LRRKRIRTRRRSAEALAVLLLAGGCGGGGGESAPPPPAIEPAAAERLAATSDSIADLLDAGDVCGAAGRADELLAQVTEAINAGAVPSRFQEDLSAKANELVNEVNCPPPPPTPTDDEDDDEGNGKKKKKEKKNDEKGRGDGDSEPPIDLIPTDPENG